MDGERKYHTGFFDFDLSNPNQSKYIDKSYCYPDQNYLTKRYSGKWHYIEFAFASWSLDPCNSMGHTWPHLTLNHGYLNQLDYN